MIAFIILLLVDLYILMNTGRGSVAPSAPATTSAEGKWTVFGTMGCGWTRKQLDYMKKKGIDHVFKDCEKGECGDVKAFPTLVSPEGEKHVGYNEM
jgi:hypothetical protein